MVDQPHEARMCSVCKQVLQQWENLTTGDKEWRHTGVTPTDCVIFIPLPVDETALVSWCDFCSSPIPARSAIVRCSTFITKFLDADTLEIVGPTVGDDGRWAACEVCADLVRAGQWADLTRHSIYCFERKHGTVTGTTRKQLHREFTRLHDVVRRSFREIEEP